MSYTRPIKTIASAGGLYSKRLAQAELPEIFSTDTEPTVKTNGDPLMDGDYWYHTTTLELKIYITNEFVLVAGPGTLKVIEDKITALNFYENELREWPHPRSLKAIKNLSMHRGATIGVDFAESFNLIFNKS